MNSEPLILEKAAVLCYRLFDIAEEIDLERARALLAQDSRRVKLTREGSQYLVLPNPPVTIELGKRSLLLRGGAVTVDVSARLFDHGAASIILRVPVLAGTSIKDLIPIADELFDSAAVEQLATEIVSQLRAGLVGALQGGHLWSQNESYTVFFVEKFQGDPDARRVLEGVNLPRLLLGETSERPLAERERLDALEHHFSYLDHDLVVVDWNAAFVYEPSGSGDIPDVLEICNAQLLELRYYDDVLDTQLRRIYDEISRKQRRWYSIFWSPYRLLTRRVLATLFELSEFIERVDNSLKIVGDVYLAKVYEASVKQLRIAPWKESVTRKQQLLAQAYTFLKGEVDTDRALTLEATIVLLIVIEVFMALTILK